MTHSPSITAIERLAETLRPEIAQTNALIEESLKSAVTLIPEIATHIMGAGGKRLRPLLTLAVAALFNYKGSHHIDLAVAVEFIHTATLLHDDVIDESDQRRGKKTANTLWGNRASILVGDALFFRAYQLIVRDKALKPLEILVNAASTLVEGEVLELIKSYDITLSKTTYFEIIQNKTAILFEAAAEVGGIVGGASEAEEKALKNFGHAFGIAFQLIDDILDYTSTPETLGKPCGNDLKEGKITLPVILAYEKAGESEKALLETLFTPGFKSEEDLQRLCTLLKQYHCLEETKEIACSYAEKARLALSSLPAHPITDLLKELVAFCIERYY